jgi:hypothetical protein
LKPVAPAAKNLCADGSQNTPPRANFCWTHHCA